MLAKHEQDREAKTTGCDECTLGRRAFLTQAMLAAAAAALAACGAGSDSPTAPTSIPSTPIKVSSYPELATVGGVALVTVGGEPLAIVRTGTTSFVALSRTCPHQGGLIGTTTGGFLCPNHGARFNTTGTWTGGQRTSNMTSYPASYDAASDTLTVG